MRIIHASEAAALETVSQEGPGCAARRKLKRVLMPWQVPCF